MHEEIGVYIQRTAITGMKKDEIILHYYCNCSFMLSRVKPKGRDQIPNDLSHLWNRETRE